MSALHHVAAAIHTAEILADEAEDVGLDDLSKELRAGALNLAADLDCAVAANDNVPQLREARRLARESLQHSYLDFTARLATHLPPEELNRVAPGAMIDIAERVRFTIRRLQNPMDAYRELCQKVRDELAQNLEAYEICIDALLAASGQALFQKDQVIRESQHFRLLVQRGKYRLLNHMDPKSAGFKRVRARVVRTRKPKWVDERRTEKSL